MKKPVKVTTEVRETAVGILSEKQEDYICLTDIARYKDPERTDYLIKEFQRLKDDENRRLSLAWNLNRPLSKLNAIGIRQMHTLTSGTTRIAIQ